MMTIFFANGHSSEIADATSVELENPAPKDRAPLLKCLDSAGNVVAQFRSDHVLRYTLSSDS